MSDEFDAGKEAGAAGEPRSANPHEPDSDAWHAWDEGWHEAQHLDEDGEPINE